MKKFGIYLFRWQTGWFIFTPILYTCDYYKIKLWLSIIIAQFIGALIYYPIDTYIFKKK